MPRALDSTFRRTGAGVWPQSGLTDGRQSERDSGRRWNLTLFGRSHVPNYVEDEWLDKIDDDRALERTLEREAQSVKMEERF